MKSQLLAIFVYFSCYVVSSKAYIFENFYQSMVQQNYQQGFGKPHLNVVRYQYSVAVRSDGKIFQELSKKL